MAVAYAVIEREIQARLKGDCLFDDQARLQYSTTASWYRINPIGIVFPRDSEDVRTVARICRDAGIAIIPRGGGTGLAGQAVGFGIILDFTRYMNRIVGRSEHSVTVQPGLILDALNRELSDSQSFFPVDPTSASLCTLGGMIATNASGWHGLRYGPTADHVESLTVVTSDGELETVEGPAGGFERLRPALQDLIAPHRAEILRRFPRVKKNSSGYNLPGLISSNPFDLRRLFAGSEGTLTIITEARLETLPRPPHRIGAVATFRSYGESVDAILHALPLNPSAIEILDRSFLLAGENLPGIKSRSISPGDAALLYFEFEGNSKESLETLVNDLRRQLGSAALDILRTDDAREEFWDLRTRISKALNLESSFGKSSFIEDVTVPVERLGRYLEELARILDRHHISFTAYGHAGVGNIHCGTFVDLKNPQHLRTIDAVASEVTNLAISLGGTLSGEHGDGFVRTPFLERVYGSTVYSLFVKIKELFDPAGILNPGKIVGTQNATILHDLAIS